MTYDLCMVSYLQAAVHQSVGTDRHTDWLLVLQLQGVLGVESEKVDELGGRVDFGLDNGFSLQR